MVQGPQAQQTTLFQTEAPIRRVLLFEDRAQITRQGTAHLLGPFCRIRLPNITPIAADRSVRVRSGELTGARLLEVRILREVEERPPLDEEQTHALEEEQRQQLQEQRHLQQRVRRLRHRLEQLDEFLSDLQGYIGQEAYYDQANDEGWQRNLEQIQQDRLETSLQLEQLHTEENRLTEKIQRLEWRLQAARQPLPQISAYLEALFEVEEEKEAELEWDYVVPCALWRPQHQARLLEQKGDPFLSFETSATVWQKTGEDWKNVELSCSTDRPTQIATPPHLSDDLLLLRKKSREERKTVVASIREQEIQTTGLGASSEAASRLPGVDDGGEVRHFEATSPVSIASDGRPVQVPLLAWQAPAQLQHRCLPERSLAVFLQSVQENRSEHPLLAGPVTLIRHNCFVGRSSIKFVAPGEGFELGWGSEDDLRLHRETSYRSSRTAVTGRQRVTFFVENYLSNLSTRPWSFQLQERLPVSELEQVQIELVGNPSDDKEECTKPLPDSPPDEEGMLRWEITLDPHQNRKITLVYRLHAPANVTLPW